MALVSLRKVRNLRRQVRYLFGGSGQCGITSLLGTLGAQIPLFFSLSVCPRMCLTLICLLFQQPTTAQTTFPKLCRSSHGLREPTVLDTPTDLGFHRALLYRL